MAKDLIEGRKGKGAGIMGPVPSATGKRKIKAKRKMSMRKMSSAR